MYLIAKRPDAQLVKEVGPGDDFRDGEVYLIQAMIYYSPKKKSKLNNNNNFN